MNKFTPLLAVTLLLASSIAWAEADRPADLRYCLDLESNYEIAKCAGEISPGSKGRPFSREKVEEILDRGKTAVPAGSNESSGIPAATSDRPSGGLSPGKIESHGN